MTRILFPAIKMSGTGQSKKGSGQFGNPVITLWIDKCQPLRDALRNTSKNQNDYIRQVKESWAKVAQDTKRKWEAVHEDMEKLANSAESVEQVQARPNLFANVFKAWTEGVNNEVVSHGSPGEPACKKRSWSEEIVCASCVAEEKNGEGKWDPQGTWHCSVCWSKWDADTSMPTAHDDAMTDLDRLAEAPLATAPGATPAVTDRVSPVNDGVTSAVAESEGAVPQCAGCQTEGWNGKKGEGQFQG